MRAGSRNIRTPGKKPAQRLRRLSQGGKCNVFAGDTGTKTKSAQPLRAICAYAVRQGYLALTQTACVLFPRRSPAIPMTTWSSRFETGHPQIDAEHQEFIRQLNMLKAAIDGGAGPERTVELIVILQKYALGHFAREEAHMLRVGCPTRGANCLAHGEFARKLERWLELLTFGGTPVSLVLEVHRESVAWIEAHILNVDCGLRGCAKQQPTSGESAQTIV
jgi:hemerythrin